MGGHQIDPPAFLALFQILFFFTAVCLETKAFVVTIFKILKTVLIEN